MDMNSLAHTTWECKYHIVFAPKYRRKIIYKKIKADVGRRKMHPTMQLFCCIEGTNNYLLKENLAKYASL